MNKRDIEKRLRAEIKKETPDVLQNVVTSSYIEKETPKATASKSMRSKRRLAVTALSACMVIALAVTLLAVFLPAKNTVTPNYTYATVQTGALNASAASDEGEITSVSFTADSEGKIESVRADNESGGVVLSSIAETLVGQQLSVGVRLVTEASAKLGYVDVTATAADGKTGVSVTVASEDNVDELNAEIKASVEGYFKQNGIYAMVSASAYTKDDIVAIVRVFDNTVTSSDDLTSLTAKLAARKSYIEEEVSRLSQNMSARMALLKVYADTMVENVQKLIDDFSGNPIYEMMVAPVQAQLDQIKGWLNAWTVVSETTFNISVTAIQTVIETNDTLSRYSEYVSDLPDDISALSDYVNATVDRLSAEYATQYKVTYEGARTAISDADYEIFISRSK